MDTNTIAMIILFATFMIFMVLRVPVTFSMLGACVLTALYLHPCIFNDSSESVNALIKQRRRYDKRVE